MPSNFLAFRPLLAIPCALVLLGTACHPAGEGGGAKSSVDFRHNPSGTGTPVVSYGHDSITQEELTRRFAEMAPQVRARYQTVAERKTFAENLARFELLAQAAAREGLANDPDVLADAKRMMVNKLIEKKLTANTPPPSDAELATYYVAHHGDFVRPERVRASLLFIAAGDKKDRAKKQASAEDLHRQASAMGPSDFVAFGKLARERSEDVRTQVLNGDTTLRPVDDFARNYGPEVAAAAQKLQHQGELSPVIASDKGFYLLKLNGHMPALNRKLEEAGVRAQISSRLSYEKRTQALDRLVAELKETEHYQLHEDALAEVKVDPTAPTVLTNGRPHGVLPLPMSGRAPIGPAGSP